MPFVEFLVAGRAVHCNRLKKPKGPWRWEIDGMEWTFHWHTGGQLDRGQGVSEVLNVCTFNQLHDAVYYSVGFADGVQHMADMMKG